MTQRRYRHEILAAFHELDPADKRSVLAEIVRYFTRRRLHLLSSMDGQITERADASSLDMGSKASKARSSTSRSKPSSSSDT